MTSTTPNPAQPITLVTGATGKTGRRVLARLEALGLPVRAGSRRASTPFDWNDARTWSAALDRVERVYIAFHPDLAIPEAKGIVGAFTEAAVEAGVSRIVLLSGRGEPGAQACERIVLDAPIEATVVRASWFLQNFDEGVLCAPIREGVLALPVDRVAEPFVDCDDIADVAVAALTEDGHAGEVYEVTGPRLVTFAEVVAAFAAATGRPIRYVPLSREAFVDGLRSAGEAEDTIAYLDWLFATTLDGRNAYVSDGVERALGRPPRDLVDYAAATATTGVWRAAA